MIYLPKSFQVDCKLQLCMSCVKAKSKIRKITMQIGQNIYLNGSEQKLSIANFKKGL
jgi:hypothetical protein